jgi:very-short-patch-repair endonuclease
MTADRAAGHGAMPGMNQPVLGLCCGLRGLSTGSASGFRVVPGCPILHGMSNALPPAWLELLERQHGVVTRKQAAAHGIDDDRIKIRLSSGRWTPLHRGVYAVFSGEPGRGAVLWAAVLRAGPGAVLRHHTAAELLGLADGERDVIDLTVPLGRHPQAVGGVRVHRSGRVPAAAHPVRLPPRTRLEETVMDLAQAAASLDDACGWLCRAVGRRLTTAARLRAALDDRSRVSRREGLLAALDDVASGAHSLLEYRYVRDVERPHGLTVAVRQARTGRGPVSRYIDQLYDEAKLAVELDGQAAHPMERRWADIRRDNAHATEGLITLRYSWSDVAGQPCLVASQIAQVLTQRGTPVTLRRCSPTCAAA